LPATATISSSSRHFVAPNLNFDFGAKFSWKKGRQIQLKNGAKFSAKKRQSQCENPA
jgi:hypothetical protein